MAYVLSVTALLAGYRANVNNNGMVGVDNNGMVGLHAGGGRLLRSTCACKSVSVVHTV